MEGIISEHSPGKQLALLKSLLSYEPYNSIISYTNLFTRSNQISAKINYNSQVLLFARGLMTELDLERLNLNEVDEEELEIRRNRKLIYTFDSREIGRTLMFDERESTFLIDYEKTSITMNSITAIDFNYYFDLDGFGTVTYFDDGKLREIRDINGGEFIYFADINLVSFKSNGETVEMWGKELVSSDDDISYKVDLPGDKEGIMFLNFHPDGALKMYRLMIDSKKQCLYYQSDIHGNIIFTSYRNDEFHGYYYDSKAEER